jgi:NADH-quinone oxidoreductase subunit L
MYGAIATVVSLAGLALGILVWRRGAEQPRLEPSFFRRGWLIDSGLAAFFGGPGRKGATVLSDGVDAKGIDGAVNGIATLVRSGGTQLRRLQTGYVRNYALGLTAGIVLLLAYVIIQLGV